MKLAIISVSDKGQDLALSLKEKLNSDSTIIKCDLYHKNVKKYFPILFSEYDGIIAIMASGILIRSIASLIESKVSDPAVLNIDDNGKFVISSLSGHLGGANELTNKIAGLIGATPVITTSTDVNKKLGIDVLARDLYLSIDDTKEILFFNKSILEGREISITINPNKNFNYLFEYLNNNTLEINVSIYYSSKINTDEIHVTLDEHKIILREKKIVVGIGCRRGKECKYIYEGLKKSLNDLNMLSSRVNMLSSAEIKKDEKGILELSEKLDIPVNFVSLDKLKLFQSNDVSKSDFVYSKFGIYGVCEPSALIMAGFDSKLIYKKTSYDGVTISIAASG
ncbi:MAG: cobalt-precorrin 5A hydrolase [Methanobrevibacter sp.]|uniref:cobalt-precorrin 5A hydrolase n=1 Tax=Methanobrevibacter sp. TaxID=66852 RepID=UPI0025E40B4E|nr:cobalt-precorrin 5A hydrolase [Methanobrevibacter sp.]MBQ8016513.1 cobalt-precorrin 5A hydrolase [Methanobrevibacter sp.]MBQ9027119.1 cobalt-precorrin 5A hydrolase [Methanobrevibacter sp.]